MIRIAICDDEKNIRDYLSSLVKKQTIECEITEYGSADEYLSADQEHDLLFLDIEMKDSLSGMSGEDKNGMWLAREIRNSDTERQPIIIFVTGYEEYVFDAFDVDTFQYLLKPVDTQKFADGMDKTIAFRNMAYIYLVTDVIQFLLIVVMLYVIVKIIKRKIWALHRKELCYLCLIPIIGLVFSEIVSRLLIVVKDHVIFGIYEQYPVFLVVVPLIAILFYVGIIATILSYQQIMVLQEEKRKYFVEQQQMITLKERTEEVEQLYEDTRRLKHEMRNHLMNIKGLSESQNYEELEQYIARMDMDLKATQFIIKTGNAVTDVIVNDKKKEADKLEIMFRSEFICPLPEKYNVYDIGIILSNLLANALEACAKIRDGEKYIILTGRQKRKFFLIEVKNSFEGGINFDMDTGLPISTKEDNQSLHGIGLSNVKSAVEKYMGDVDIRVTKNEFCVTVLLQEHRK